MGNLYKNWQSLFAFLFVFALFLTVSSEREIQKTILLKYARRCDSSLNNWRSTSGENHHPPSLSPTTYSNEHQHTNLKKSCELEPMLNAIYNYVPQTAVQNRLKNKKKNTLLINANVTVKKMFPTKIFLNKKYTIFNSNQCE